MQLSCFMLHEYIDMYIHVIIFIFIHCSQVFCKRKGQYKPVFCATAMATKTKSRSVVYSVRISVRMEI